VDEIRVAPETRIAFVLEPRSLAADRFRYLRMRLRELRSAASVRTVLITSPQPQDGKSTVAANLATALAEHGKHPVLFLEADLHRPSLIRTLGLPTHAGLAECLADGISPLSLVRKVEPLGWYYLQAGIARVNPSELIQADSLGSVMDELTRHFEWIVIDTPPINVLADAALIARQADTSLMVVRADHTPKPDVTKACELIGTSRILGIVLNGADSTQAANEYTKYYSAS
jgi:receptor protein-tyrosine kinase